jgi:hypothetical protein
MVRTIDRFRADLEQQSFALQNKDSFEKIDQSPEPIRR